MLMADLNEPLPVDDGAFDWILASFDKHSSEFKPSPPPPQGGRLVCSTHHPFMDPSWLVPTIISRPIPLVRRGSAVGKAMTMRFRSLHAMGDPVKSAGFQFDILSEPQPDPRASSLFPQASQSLKTKARFLLLGRKIMRRSFDECKPQRARGVSTLHKCSANPGVAFPTDANEARQAEIGPEASFEIFLIDERALAQLGKKTV